VSQSRAACLPPSFDNLRAVAATLQTKYYTSVQEYFHFANLHPPDTTLQIHHYYKT